MIKIVAAHDSFLLTWAAWRSRLLTSRESYSATGAEAQ